MAKVPKKVCRTENIFFEAMLAWLRGGLSALICGGLAAWLLLPHAYEQRAGFEIGGEWLVVLAVALIAFGFGKCLLGRR